MGDENNSAVDNHSILIATPEMVNDWRKNYIKEGHTIHSTNTYYNYIKLFIGTDGKQINQKTVDQFREEHPSCVGVSALKNFFNFLVFRKDFPRDILFIYYGKTKHKKVFPESLQVVEVEKIIPAIESLRMKHLTIFIYELALRVSEALKVKWEDFNWATWLLDQTQYGTVTLKNTKRNKFRVLPVRPQIMKMLYEDNPNRTSDGIPIGGLVFELPKTGTIQLYIFNKEKTNDENLFDYIKYAENLYSKELDKAAMKVLNKKVNPHKLRHSKAQDLMNNNMSIESLKLMLGHQTISTTEIYAQASPTKLKKELADIERFKKQQNMDINNGQQ